MQKYSWLTIVTFLLATAVSSAQSISDFTGIWILDAARSGAAREVLVRKPGAEVRGQPTGIRADD
jgi:hypothetical protein